MRESSERHRDANRDGAAVQPKSHPAGRKTEAAAAACLFAYGTLRPGAGHRMAAYLARRGRLLGPARAPGRLYDLGRYPGMTGPRAADEWVRGDVYELDDPAATLAVLDRYERCA